LAVAKNIITSVMPAAISVQRYNGICYEGQHFVLVDVIGDGSCLYHAIALDEKVNINDHMALRSSTLSEVYEWYRSGVMAVTKVFNVFKTAADGTFSQRHGSQ